jgi:hypothetical protein
LRDIPPSHRFAFTTGPSLQAAICGKASCKNIGSGWGAFHAKTPSRKGTSELVSVAEGTFFDFAQLGRLAFCGLAEVGVARWAKRAV